MCFTNPCSLPVITNFYKNLCSKWPNFCIPLTKQPDLRNKECKFPS